MALVFLEGFEHYGTGATGFTNMLAGPWAEITNTGTWSIVSSPVRTGTKSLRYNAVNSTPNVLRYNKKVASDIIGVGCGVHLENLPSNVILGISVRNASNSTILSVSFNPDGSLSLYKGSFAGTLIETSDTYLTAGTFHHVEFRALIDDTVGEFELRVNGVVALQLGGLNLGTAPAKMVCFGGISGTTTPQPYVYFDDIFIWDNGGTYNNDFLGPLRVLTVFADGDGSPQDWDVTGAATGHEAIDEVPSDGDTSFISTGILNEKATFTLPELPVEVSYIAGIYLPVLSRIEEAGTGSINASIISNGLSYYGGDNQPLTSSYTYWPFTFDYDPNTDVAWTKSGFEAAAFQIEKVA